MYQEWQIYVLLSHKSGFSTATWSTLSTSAPPRAPISRAGPSELLTRTINCEVEDGWDSGEETRPPHALLTHQIHWEWLGGEGRGRKGATLGHGGKEGVISDGKGQTRRTGDGWKGGDWETGNICNSEGRRWGMGGGGEEAKEEGSRNYKGQCAGVKRKCPAEGKELVNYWKE